MNATMERSLLEKSRRLNGLLQRSAGTQVDFSEMTAVLADLVNARIYVLSRKGKFLGASAPNAASLVGTSVSEEVNHKLLRMDSTSVGATVEGLPAADGESITIVPIFGGDERLGTLVAVYADRPFADQDLLLAELGATMFGVEILRSHSAEREEENRKQEAAQVAVATLSYSEQEAIRHIFAELNGKNECLLVASKIADRVGITRSVIVNALRKLESAGVIESRSLGMKGTHIRVKNDRLVEQVRKLG